MKAEFIVLSETRHFWISHYTYLLTNRLTHVHTTSLKFVKPQIYKLVHGYYLLHRQVDRKRRNFRKRLTEHEDG